MILARVKGSYVLLVLAMINLSPYHASEKKLQLQNWDQRTQKGHFLIHCIPHWVHKCLNTPIPISKWVNLPFVIFMTQLKCKESFACDIPFLRQNVGGKHICGKSWQDLHFASKGCALVAAAAPRDWMKIKQDSSFALWCTAAMISSIHIAIWAVKFTLPSAAMISSIYIAIWALKPLPSGLWNLHCHLDCEIYIAIRCNDILNLHCHLGCESIAIWAVKFTLPSVAMIFWIIIAIWAVNPLSFGLWNLCCHP